ncbi:MAG: sodium:proton exchanger [Acidobacteria bacterium RBG_16_70_10]|nr:MAG: sodium:proton exchanger [Acidobacteria bacterium RBG_16_70_10]
MPHDTPLIATIAGAFLSAWVLGSLAQKVGLSPIVGYLLAGVVIGPHTPGFVADAALAAQLAEIGVVLLMFGVGLHFHPKDLLAVKGIAIPGALVQSACATLLGVATGLAFGWPVSAGLLLGVALSVASTVVLMRALEDAQLLSTVPGHIAVGWLIVEDVLTVVVLVVIPALAGAAGGGAVASSATSSGFLAALGLALAKLAVLVALVLLAGSRVIPWLLEQAARLRSRELFTLTVLALAMAIATGAAFFFGTSVALGAFLAGMVVGQSPVSHQAAADALPLRDAFGVLFFVSVGMLFDPGFLLREPALVLAALAVVLIGKPLAAIAVVAALGYSARTALVVAIGLAQIGEFSFILGELARHHGLLPPAGSSVLVACALVSISVNPLLFRLLDPLDQQLRSHPWLWRLLNARSERRGEAVNVGTARAVEKEQNPLAVIVGYGPVGQSVDRALREWGLDTVVIDLNIDTVSDLAREGRLALYGDASHTDVLKKAGIARAAYLLVTLPHSVNRGPLIAAARNLNPACRIIVRARYLRERAELDQAGATAACFEEIEAAVALTERLLRDLGTDDVAVERERERIRRQFAPEA